MLYSYMGNYPKELPSRLVLPNGFTKTDKSTFSSEDILNSGYIEVSEKPIVEYPEYVTWNPDEKSWIIEEFSLLEVKEKIKKDITSNRYRFEINHPTIDSTRQGQAMLTSIAVILQREPDKILNFKDKNGTWVSADKEYIDILENELSSYIESCFDTEMALHTSIDACSSISEVMSIDIHSIWQTI